MRTRREAENEGMDEDKEEGGGREVEEDKDEKLSR